MWKEYLLKSNLNSLVCFILYNKWYIRVKGFLSVKSYADTDTLCLLFMAGPNKVKCKFKCKLTTLILGPKMNFYVVKQLMASFWIVYFHKWR